MKKYIIILLMFLMAYLAKAQEGISFSVLQDVKLGLGMDKKHGNDSPTMDIIVNMNFEGKQFEWYYFSMQTQFEKANLSSGDYYRYSVHSIWTLNKLIIPKLRIGLGCGLGVIHRPLSGGLLSYSGTMDISYTIFKNTGLTIKNELVRRPDLPNKKIGYNLSFGLTFKLINLN